MDEGKCEPQFVGDGRGTFSAACIGTDNDGITVVGNVLLDVAL
jgi:hypothetical protein